MALSYNIRIFIIPITTFFFVDLSVKWECAFISFTDVSCKSGSQFVYRNCPHLILDNMHFHSSRILFAPLPWKYIIPVCANFCTRSRTQLPNILNQMPCIKHTRSHASTNAYHTHTRIFYYPNLHLHLLPTCIKT